MDPTLAPAPAPTPTTGRPALLQAVAAGLGDALPASVSILLSFVVVGAAVEAAGLTHAQSVLLTALVFAAPAQLLAADLIRQGSDLAVIAAVFALINARFFFMTLSLVRQGEGIPTARLLLWASMLSAVSFALVSGRRAAVPEAGREGFEVHLAVVCLTLYLTAVAGTAFGAAVAAYAGPPLLDVIEFLVVLLLAGRLLASRGDRVFVTVALASLALAGFADGLLGHYGGLVLSLGLAAAAALHGALPRRGIPPKHEAPPRHEEGGEDAAR